MTLFKYESTGFRKVFLLHHRLWSVGNFANLREVLFGGRSRLPAAAFFYSPMPESAMRYQGGVDTQLNALDADRDLLQAQLDLRQIKLNELLSVVQLYKALGGGWQT